MLLLISLYSRENKSYKSYQKAYIVLKLNAKNMLEIKKHKEKKKRGYINIFIVYKDIMFNYVY